VEPPLHRHDRPAGEGPADELALVALDGRVGVVGQVGVGDDGLGLDLAALFGVDTGGRDYFGVAVPSGDGPEIGASEVNG